MQLKEIVPWGRTLAEYKLMFDLADVSVESRILGCGDGPASFNAEMTELGYSVVSIDPIYQFSKEQIRQQVEAAYKPLIAQIKQNAHRFIWQNFRDADDLGQARLAAMERFLQDYDAGKAAGRYLPQALPHLEISTHQFDLCVCSHLLFLYSGQLSLEFHLAAIAELLRVASEVQIFPLLMLDGNPSPYVEPVMQALSQSGFIVEVQAVGYEFQAGGNQMLKLSQLRSTVESRDRFRLELRRREQEDALG